MNKPGSLMLRESRLRDLFRRASGKACYGYDSRTGRGGKIKPGAWDCSPVPTGTKYSQIDRICVEGEPVWETIPVIEIQ